MIYLATLILIIIACTGIALLRSITKETRIFVFIPAGMICGVSLYIFLLNLNSKFLHGQPGIILSTITLILIGIASYFITRHKTIKLEKLNIITLLLVSCLILSIIYLSRLKMTATMPSADADMQWAYAASFARGNYPIKASWQPDLNPNYHLGAYFLEGALLSILGLPLITIHALLNTYFLIAGTLLAIFIFWENKYSFRNIWLIAASSILYLPFGVIIFLVPSQNFLQIFHFPNQAFLSLINKFVTLVINKLVTSYTTLVINLPEGIIAKGTSGASLVDLNSLSYLPARSLSLGLALLALYFSFAPFKNSKIKILSFVLLLSVTALVEESMFLPLFGVIVSVFVLSFFTFIPNLKYLKAQRKNLFFIILLTSILIFLQGGFFSDLFNKQESSFRATLPFISSSFIQKLELLKSYYLQNNLEIFNLFLLGPFWLAAITLIYGFLAKKKSLCLLGIYSSVALFCFLTIEYKYYPSNNIRFFNFAYISSGVSFIYLLSTLLQSRSLRTNLSVFAVTGLFVLTPTLLPELLNQSQQIKTAKSQNIRSQILIQSNPKTPFEEISSWASQHLPLNSRLIAIDTDLPNLKRSIQFEYKGLYTVLGPQYVRVLRQEPGIEFFDLVLTLNPSLLKQTKAEYVYIESASPFYQQLPQLRKDNLSNSSYFQKLISINEKEVFYTLYKVLPAFLDPNTGGQEIKDITLQNLQSLIPNNASVYIARYGDSPQLSFWYRMAVILSLKDKDIRRDLTQTDYMAIETNIPKTSGALEEKYDYYVLGPNDKPPYPATLIWSNILSSAWKRH